MCTAANTTLLRVGTTAVPQRSVETAGAHISLWPSSIHVSHPECVLHQFCTTTTTTTTTTDQYQPVPVLHTTQTDRLPYTSTIPLTHTFLLAALSLKAELKLLRKLLP